uniref:SFRICE_040909 n=1 Tax=Spodoptera frugiperda TaxID=7108 RepID=A0A2H1WNS8_SPOFR
MNGTDAEIVNEMISVRFISNNNGEYSSRSLPRVRLDNGANVGTAGVRLRCWAAPPSITEEDVEEEIEEDAVSLRAMPAQG